MVEISFEPVFWHWLVLGVALIILEVFAPGTFFLWMGIAAFVVGGLLWVAPELSWEFQVLLFAMLSVSSIVASRMYLRRHPIQSEQSDLNRRGRQHVGKRYVVAEAIVNGSGRVRVGDSLWKASGPDCGVGETVLVTDVEGTVLMVEPPGEK